MSYDCPFLDHCNILVRGNGNGGILKIGNFRKA